MNDDCPYCEFKDGMNIEHECLEQRAKEKIDRLADECEALEQESLRHLKYLSDANKEVEHQKNLKEAFEKHSWELAERNNKIIDALEAECARLREEIKCWETDAGLTKKLRENEYEKNIDFWQRRCTQKQDRITVLEEAIQECLSSGKIEYWWAERLQKALTHPQEPKEGV